jgi:hypothetical protein
MRLRMNILHFADADDDREAELDHYCAHLIEVNPFGRLADGLEELLDEGRQS